MNTLEVILFIVVFGAILFLTYVATRFVAGKTSKAMKGKHISLVETVSLGTDKRIHLIKAGGQHFLISSTSKQVQFLDRVEIQEESPEPDYENPLENNVFDFKKLFDKYVNNYRNKKVDGENPATDGGQPSRSGQLEVKPDDIFFRSNLDKLRSITQKKNKEAYKNGVEYTNEE